MITLFELFVFYIMANKEIDIQHATYKAHFVCEGIHRDMNLNTKPIIIELCSESWKENGFIY